MKTNPISQHGAAVALVQLLEEHPELSESVSWSISRTTPSLYGFAHDGGLELLNAVAAIVGGSVVADGPYERTGQSVCGYSVSSVWRDVRVEVATALPVAESAQVAA
ncbi:hypothetical protein ACIQFU_22830 [Streptomyces sp. NPDC093065]|uniref:hypothetical protein n=1 Tax=Streptomyces sp. NPDC093065 TaxID=3366021 RepID=UPI00380CD40A